ncbi:MAG: hypothetical protein WD512_05620 [Candidatus Paceibacterota bacterium]
MIKFISDPDKCKRLDLSGYYPNKKKRHDLDVYDDYDFETEYDGKVIVRRYITITIKKKYLNT